MKLNVHWNGLIVAPSVRDHLERRLAFALGRRVGEVTQVWARLEDLNGPRGGVDKRVSLQIRGRRLKSLVLSECGADLLVAIDRAADRLGRALSRALARKHHRRRAGGALLPERARTPRRR